MAQPNLANAATIRWAGLIMRKERFGVSICAVVSFVAMVVAAHPTFVSAAIADEADQAGEALSRAVKADYDAHLGELFRHFHANPELSFQETQTARRVARELRDIGFTVTEGVGGTGVVAILENGPGPRILVRADMDGLPVAEKSGLPYASTATQADLSGKTMPVMHACGHDMHMTSLIGTARRMVAMKDTWSGTLMLIGQPAEESIGGAKAMRADRLYERFGKPDMALALHVWSGLEAGLIDISDAAPYSGSDGVEIIVHGIGAHGASPQHGKDPVVLASQIVLALQTLVSRELGPYEPGVVTVGLFQAGTKRNIISDRAELQLTVRSDSPETRARLFAGIERIAKNMGRAAGLPEDKLPTVTLGVDSTPPTVNTPDLAHRLKALWTEKFGPEVVVTRPKDNMGAEDFPYLTNDPHIPSVYFRVGGTAKADLERAAAGGDPVPSHHSPLFRIAPEPSVRRGVEAMVTALLDLMPNRASH